MKFNQLSEIEKSKFFQQSRFELRRDYIIRAAEVLNPTLQTFKKEYFLDERDEDKIVESAYEFYYKDNRLKLKDGVHIAQLSSNVLTFQNGQQLLNIDGIRGLIYLNITIKNGIIVKKEDIKNKEAARKEFNKNKFEVELDGKVQQQSTNSNNFGILPSILLLLLLIICCCFAYHAAYGKEITKKTKRQESSPAATQYRAVNLDIHK